MSSNTSAEFTLYGYFRSSAAFRVRIALNLKGIRPELRFVHLRKDGGQQNTAEYLALNPQGLIPMLVHKGATISQSLAIIEYLDEVVPEPALLPGDPAGKARVRQLSDAVACDIHPVNNLRVLNYLRDEMGASDEDRTKWQRRWIMQGFSAMETWLSSSPQTSRFCHGDQPTMADIFLIPQMTNARRVQIDLEAYPTLLRIEKAAFDLSAFVDAQPQMQPDAE